MKPAAPSMEAAVVAPPSLPPLSVLGLAAAELGKLAAN